MTDEEIRYKGFLVVWKTLRQCRSPYYLITEKILKRCENNTLTNKQLEMISLKWVESVIEMQKEKNLEMFIAAILATSDDRFERAKQLHKKKIAKMRRKRANLPK